MDIIRIAKLFQCLNNCIDNKRRLKTCKCGKDHAYGLQLVNQLIGEIEEEILELMDNHLTMKINSLIK